jgi:multicomponent K+:H+ antiporter subunit E
MTDTPSTHSGNNSSTKQASTLTLPAKTWWQKLFPHPFLTILLAVGWIMLVHQISIGQIIIAIIAATIIPRITQFFIQPAEPVHWPTAFKLFFIVLWDIIVSNIRVAKQILGPIENLHPKWLRVPLDTTHPKVNTLLALIITTTPGTVSAGLDDDQNTILVHALTADNAQDVIDDIKTRYEQPLIKLFSAKRIEDTP